MKHLHLLPANTALTTQVALLVRRPGLVYCSDLVPEVHRHALKVDQPASVRCHVLRRSHAVHELTLQQVALVQERC
jgi:hypothetical protein